jgi:hypothetical protein
VGEFQAEPLDEYQTTIHNQPVIVRRFSAPPGPPLGEERRRPKPILRLADDDCDGDYHNERTYLSPGNPIYCTVPHRRGLVGEKPPTEDWYRLYGYPLPGTMTPRAVPEEDLAA